MDSDSLTFYSVIKFFIDLVLIVLILFSIIICMLTGGLWLKMLLTGGTFKALYLLLCIIFRLVSGWLIKIKDGNLALNRQILTNKKAP